MLAAVGFESVTCGPNASRIPDFKKFELDVAGGAVVKPKSVFMEGSRVRTMSHNLLDSSRRSLNPRDWGRRREDPVPQKEIAAPVPIRKDEEMRRIWEQDWQKLSGD